MLPLSPFVQGKVSCVLLSRTCRSGWWQPHLRRGVSKCVEDSSGSLEMGSTCQNRFKHWIHYCRLLKPPQAFWLVFPSTTLHRTDLLLSIASSRNVVTCRNYDSQAQITPPWPKVAEGHGRIDQPWCGCRGCLGLWCLGAILFQAMGYQSSQIHTIQPFWGILYGE